VATLLQAGAAASILQRDLTDTQLNQRVSQARRLGSELSSWNDALGPLNQVQGATFNDASQAQQTAIRNAWAEGAGSAAFVETQAPPGGPPRAQGDHVFNDFIGDLRTMSTAGQTELHLPVVPPRVADHYRRLKVTYSPTGETNSTQYGEAKTRAVSALAELRQTQTRKTKGNARASLDQMLGQAIDQQALATLRQHGGEATIQVLEAAIAYMERLTPELLLSNFRI
jgi:hypothetical protein